MSTKQEIREHHQLRHVRMAIHGWAFTDKDGIVTRLEHGTREVNLVPKDLQEAANKLLEPLRQALGEKNECRTGATA